MLCYVVKSVVCNPFHILVNTVKPKMMLLCAENIVYNNFHQASDLNFFLFILYSFRYKIAKIYLFL